MSHEHAVGDDAVRWMQACTVTVNNQILRTLLIKSFQKCPPCIRGCEFFAGVYVRVTTVNFVCNHLCVRLSGSENVLRVIGAVNLLPVSTFV